MKTLFVRVPLSGNFDLVVKLAGDVIDAMVGLDDKLRDCPVEAITYIHASKREFTAWTLDKQSTHASFSTDRPRDDGKETALAEVTRVQWRLAGDGVLYAVVLLAPNTPPKAARVAELRALLKASKKE